MTRRRTKSLGPANMVGVSLDELSVALFVAWALEDSAEWTIDYVAEYWADGRKCGDK